MATFIWDPAVRWPPPADILMNYDVIGPNDPLPSPAAGESREKKDETQMLVSREALEKAWKKAQSGGRTGNA